VEFVKELPRTSTGKVLKRELKDGLSSPLYKGGMASSEPISSRSAGLGLQLRARDGRLDLHATLEPSSLAAET
jgi:hypothetical protein